MQNKSAESISLIHRDGLSTKKFKTGVESSKKGHFSGSHKF